MRMFPIVSREMRVAARKPMTYWNRAAVALGAAAVALFALIVLGRESPKSTGYIMFVWMSVIAYGHCLLTGLLLTSDSLAEEKRDGTLGLLFLTDLKGYDVVFGKLVASSLRGVYGLLAIFPVLGLCLLLGGVTGREFGRVMLVCVNNLFLSLSVGMLASALCRDERKAMGLAFFVMLVLTAGVPALGTYIVVKFHLNSPPLFPFALSPGFASILAFDKVSMGFPRPAFYQSVITQHVMAWAALGVACYVVPRSWQDKASSAAGVKRGARWQQWMYGAPAVRAALRGRLLNVNPYYWLVSRDRTKQVLPWLWLAFAGLVWALGLWKLPSDFREVGMYITTALALHTLFKLWIALEASRQLGADRQSGALELLLCTPLSVRDILRGQWLGLVRQFGPAVLVIVALDFMFLFGGWPVASNDRTDWLLLWLAGISVFLLDLTMLSWCAMWLGLRRRRSGQGGIHAVVRICVLPWTVFGVFLAVMALLEEFHIMRIHRWENALPWIWWVMSVGISAAFGVSAYRQLHRNLRAVAAERYLGRAAALGRALGLIFGRMRSENATASRVGPAGDGAGASRPR